MARAGLDPYRRHPGPGSFLPVRAVARGQDSQWADLSRLCRRSAAGHRRARSRRGPRQVHISPGGCHDDDGRIDICGHHLEAIMIERCWARRPSVPRSRRLILDEPRALLGATKDANANALSNHHMPPTLETKGAAILRASLLDLQVMKLRLSQQTGLVRAVA